MTRHVFEQYEPGRLVEIIFSHIGKDNWQPAIVLRAEPPGLWVMTADGREWFVTNTYRIRAAEEKSSADLADSAD
jgi:hypothetical protein